MHNTKTMTRYLMVTEGQKFLDAVLYEPAPENENDKARKQISILLIHSHVSYLGHPAAAGLSKEGYTVLTMNLSDPDICFDEKLQEVAIAVRFLKEKQHAEKVILLGSSGGASLMSAYQAIAENGVSVFQGDPLLFSCTIEQSFQKADGMILLDSNWGNGAMTLLSMDPEVTETQGGLALNCKYDRSNPDAGYNSAQAHYTSTFLREYQQAQAERNNEVVHAAMERWEEIRRGKGRFLDDEPLVIPGGSQIGPCNKLFPQDISLLAETKEKRDLLHPDGSVTNEVVRSQRHPQPLRPLGKTMRPGAQITSVRTFLDTYAVFAQADGSFRYDKNGVYGIDFNSSYNCTPGNVQHITVPALIMGMTDGYEFLASELIWEKYRGEDKTLVFAEGVNHMLLPAWECETFPGQYQAAPTQAFRYIGKWLDSRFIH